MYLDLTARPRQLTNLNICVQTVQERYRHTMLWRQGLDNAAGDQTPWGTDLDSRGRRSVPPELSPRTLTSTRGRRCRVDSFTPEPSEPKSSCRKPTLGGTLVPNELTACRKSSRRKKSAPSIQKLTRAPPHLGAAEVKTSDPWSASTSGPWSA